MKQEIKLIHSKERKEFRVTVNGIDMYPPFKHTEDPDDETDKRRIAKAVAFEECFRATNKGHSIKATYVEM
jgi:hypothetical protein